MLRYGFIFSLLVLFFHSAAFAVTEEELALQRMQDKVNSLEKNLSTMQQEFYRSSGKGKKQQAIDTTEFVGADAERVRSFNGKIEEIDHKVNTLATKLDKIIADIDFRISAIEKKVNEASSKASEEKAEEAKKQEDSNNEEEKNESQNDKQNQEKVTENKDSVTENKVPESKTDEAKSTENKDQKSPEKTADSKAESKVEAKTDTKKHSGADQYEKALELLRANKYAEAEKAFKEFIKGNKDTELASNSYYWLGETFYARENFQQAAVQFLKGYQDYQKGGKAADNLLKLAMSLRKLKKDKEACATLDKLKKEYPNADKDLLAKVYTERQEIRCK